MDTRSQVPARRLTSRDGRLDALGLSIGPSAYNPRMSSSRRSVGLEVGAASFLCLLLGLPSLTFPMGVDQGTLGVWAQQLARGLVPYRDVWDQRPPLMHLLHFLVYAGGVSGMELTRVTDLLVQVATAGVLGLLALRMFGRGAGILAGALYAYCYFGQADFHHTSQPDGLVGLFAALAILFALQSGPKRRLLSGAMLGLAFLAKYPAALLFPVLVGIAPEGGDWKRRARQAMEVALGAAVPVLSLIVWLAATGALGDFLMDTVVFNLGHGKIGTERPELSMQALEVLAQLLNRREVLAPLLLLPLARLERRSTLVAGAWGLVSFLMVLVQRKFFSYHFLPLVAPLALLSAGAVRGLALRLVAEPAPRMRKVTWAIALVLTLGAGYRTAARWGRSAVAAVQVASDDEARRAFHALHVNPFLGFSLGDDLEAAAAIKAMARPGDRLLVFGAPLLYYLSELQPATRFIMDSPFVAKGHPERYDRELERALDSRPPEFVAVYLRNTCRAVTGYDEPSASLLRLQPKAQRRLAELEKVLELETVAVYASRERAAALAP